MSFRGRTFFNPLSFPPEAGAFMSHARTLGATFTTSQTRALAYLVNNLADLGIGAPGSNFIIYPFIGGTNSATNALNLFYPKTSAYNLTFVGSPTHSTSGVAFNGISQYAYGQSLGPYPLSPNLTLANISFGCGVTGMGGASYVPMGFFMSTGVQTKVYSTAASYLFDFNVEAPGVTSFTASAFGGGGAGGGSNGTTSNRPGGGGAGGGYATRAFTLTGTQLDTSLSITVGVAGAANVGAAGGAGGDCTVSHPNITTVTAKGGPGGNVNTAGAAGAAVAGAAGNAGTTTFTGGRGSTGGTAVGFGGGGGGSSAGTAANGNPGTFPTGTAGGAGGSAPTGGFAGGAGGLGLVSGAGNAGTSGNAGGRGGGGGGATNAGNNRAGGAGGAGRVTIAWSATPFKRASMSIFTASGNQLLDIAADSDPSSRIQINAAAPSPTNGVRVGSRRANTTAASAMGYYVISATASPTVGPAVMTTTSFSPSPVWYLGGLNSWSASGGVGNSLSTPLSGTMNFAFMGPGLSNTQLQSFITLINVYNRILGR